MLKFLAALLPTAFARDLATSDAAFLALGDWGAKTDSDKMVDQLRANAIGLGKFAEEYPFVSFIAALGDNFYNYGVVTATDNRSDANWKDSWIDVFNSHGSRLAALPWYAVLGNHGYGFNPEAQVDATKAYPGKWNMPARSFIHRVKLTPNATRYISYVFFDSTPCINEYRSKNESNWDPKPPPSSGSTWDKEHYAFPENLKAEPCQSDAFAKLLAQTEASDWKIVIAHHRADQMNFNVVSLLAKYDVDLYLNGHLHSLEAYTLSGTKTKFLTIGSGCVLAPKSAEEEKKFLTEAAAKGITYQFRADEPGFGGFFFQDNYATLQANLYHSNFTSIHSITLSK